MSIEADIRSGEKKKRRITLSLNGWKQKVVIIGVPETIRFGVCLISLFRSFSQVFLFNIGESVFTE